MASGEVEDVHSTPIGRPSFAFKHFEHGDLLRREGISCDRLTTHSGQQFAEDFVVIGGLLWHAAVSNGAKYGLGCHIVFAMRVPPAINIKCYAIQSGSCWLQVGTDEPLALEAGDTALVFCNAPLSLFRGVDPVVVDALDLFPSVPAGETVVLRGGGACSGVGGFFAFDGAHAEVLLEVLPSIVHIRGAATGAALSGSIERLMSELRHPQPGSDLIAQHLAQVLLVETLRLHLMNARPSPTGWLFALADRRLRTAVAAMHSEPARRWTLSTLASVAGMSRSSFAEQFKNVTGHSPIEYLTRWRIFIAAGQLEGDRLSVSEVASSVGYQSDSAFGAAFKRLTGAAPRQFRKAKERI